MDDVGTFLGGLVLIGIVVAIGLFIILAGAAFVLVCLLAYLLLWVCRDQVVASWDIRSSDEAKESAKIVWSVVTPLCGTVIVFFVAYAILQPSINGQWLDALVLAYALAFIGSYYYFLNTTTPKHDKWKLFLIREKFQEFESELHHIEQQTERKAHALVSEKKIHRLTEAEVQPDMQESYRKWLNKEA
jgi:hypothetical protein